MARKLVMNLGRFRMPGTPMDGVRVERTGTTPSGRVKVVLLEPRGMWRKGDPFEVAADQFVADGAP